MEAVLPIKVGGEGTYELDRLSILLVSISQFWKGSGLFRIYVVTPGRELDVVRGIQRPAGVDLVFVDEDDVVPGIGRHPAHGWYKQQVIKLASHVLMSGSHFLTLDADIIACRPFTEEDLLPSGLAVADWEKKSFHLSWWEASSGLIGQGFQPDSFGLSVTPQILSTQICRGLEDELVASHGAGAWDHLLAHQGWTEYTIYTLCAERSQALGDVYHPPEFVAEHGLALRSNPGTFWSGTQYVDWKPELAFASTSGMFMVCQSRCGIPPAYIWAKIHQHFPRSGLDRLLAPGRDIDIPAIVVEAYRGLLGREPDDAGLQGYIQSLESGSSLASVFRSMTSSAEFRSRLGSQP